MEAVTTAVTNVITLVGIMITTMSEQPVLMIALGAGVAGIALKLLGRFFRTGKELG